MDKPPWTVTWGGGASIESPHFQRVHYCELLVRFTAASRRGSDADQSERAQVKEFLMRVRCKRFPPIEKDMKMVLAHCGSLFLDPAALADTYRELVVLEALHMRTECSPAATVEAILKRSFSLN